MCAVVCVMIVVHFSRESFGLLLMRILMNVPYDENEIMNMIVVIILLSVLFGMVICMILIYLKT